MYCGGENTAENSKIEDKAGKEDTNEKEKCFGDSVVNSIDSEHSDTCDCSGSRRAVLQTSQEELPAITDVGTEVNDLVDVSLEQTDEAAGNFRIVFTPDKEMADQSPNLQERFGLDLSRM